MLKFLTNITTIADENIVNDIGRIYQFLKFAITNLSTPYMICGFIIVICMLATTLRNLIYKVLNLAVLSVFVVALWAYLTDVTFIYVVYILTFVSAVVMLFLSVVLMLPSSAIAIAKRNASIVLLAASTGASETSVIGTIANITVAIVTLCFILIVIYLVWHYYRAGKLYYDEIKVEDIYFTEDPEVEKFPGSVMVEKFHPPLINAVLEDVHKLTFRWWPARHLYTAIIHVLVRLEHVNVDNDTWYYNTDAVKKDMAAFKAELDTEWVEENEYRKELHNFEGSVFCDMLIRYIPVAVAYPLAKFAARLAEHGPSYYFNKCKRAFYTARVAFHGIEVKHGVVARFHTIYEDELTIYNHLFSPTTWYVQIVACAYTNVESILAGNTGGRSGYKVFNDYYGNPDMPQVLKPRAVYIRDNMYYPGVIGGPNKEIFDMVFARYIITNIKADIRIIRARLRRKLPWLNSSWFITQLTPLFNSLNTVNAELAAQTTTTVSVFFLAIPAGLTNSWATFTYSHYLIDAGASRLVENLAAVQQGLYVDQPLLLLVSITGLLVALIGAPFFVSRTNK